MFHSWSEYDHERRFLFFEILSYISLYFCIVNKISVEVYWIFFILRFNLWEYRNFSDDFIISEKFNYSTMIIALLLSWCCYQHSQFFLIELISQKESFVALYNCTFFLFFLSFFCIFPCNSLAFLFFEIFYLCVSRRRCLLFRKKMKIVVLFLNIFRLERHAERKSYVWLMICNCRCRSAQKRCMMRLSSWSMKKKMR